VEIRNKDLKPMVLSDRVDRTLTGDFLNHVVFVTRSELVARQWQQIKNFKIKFHCTRSKHL
jgi:hypothetical protein